MLKPGKSHTCTLIFSRQCKWYFAYNFYFSESSALFQHVVSLITDQVFMHVIILFPDILLIQNAICHKPRRDMLSGVMEESTTSQHPVFKPNFQFSKADCSAARLPGRKKKKSEILPCVSSATLVLFLSNLPFFIPNEKLCWFIIWLKSVYVFIHFIFSQYRMAPYLSCNIAVT